MNKTAKERDNMDLLELVCQLHSRALRYPSEEMHKAYIDARKELESRLSPSQSSSTQPAQKQGYSVEELFSKWDIDFIESALNFYWNDAFNNLERKDLGDIEQEVYKKQKDKSKYLMDKIEQLPTPSLVKPDLWIEIDENDIATYPEHNLGVLVFIPQEDNHITSGMWDVDDKWVLLDEYRVMGEVTHWQPLPSPPTITVK